MKRKRRKSKEKLVRRKSKDETSKESSEGTAETAETATEKAKEGLSSRKGFNYITASLPAI